jgi:hypothetical protein
MFAAVLFVSLMLLALGAWWASEWSGLAALAVVGSTAIGTGLVAASLLVGFREPLGQSLLVAWVTLLTLNWLAVGANLQRLPEVLDNAPAGDDPVTEPAPA